MKRKSKPRVSIIFKQLVSGQLETHSVWSNPRAASKMQSVLNKENPSRLCWFIIRRMVIEDGEK